VARAQKPPAFSGGAWQRTEANFYGQGRFPFGQCTEPVCGKAACFRLPPQGGLASRLVCLHHKPKRFFFLPFLGQQEKLFMADERWVLAGGGAGGSKSFAGTRMFLKQWRHEQARYLQARREGREFQSKGWSIFLRRTMNPLIPVVEDFKRFYKRVDPAAQWVAQKSLCIFSNGFHAQFGGMEDDDGWKNYYGPEYSLVVFDEATQFTRTQILELDGRIRCPDPLLGKMNQLYLLTNPVGGVTKAWLNKKFVTAAPPETRIPVTVTLADGRKITKYRIYIPSNLYDNPALMDDGEYEANLRSKGSAQKRALLFNDWSVDEGSWVGEDYDPTRHVCDPFPIPTTWPNGKSADWGSASRASVLYWALDPNNGLVIYDAWSCRRMTARQAAEAIKQRESRPLMWRNPSTGKTVQVCGPRWDADSDMSNVPGVMDASVWSKQGHELSIGEIFDNVGCCFSRSAKGTHIKHTAADLIRTRLQTPLDDGRGGNYPALRIFRGTTETEIRDDEGDLVTTGLIATLPAIQIDPDDPDIWDTKGDDHDMDALQYLVTSRALMPLADTDEPAEVLDYVAFKAAAAAAATEKWDW